jgi:SAM-dependent methyltransferase
MTVSSTDASFESLYLSGKRLYGDDFTPEQIAEWFEDEREGYADLGAGASDGSGYGYHQLNERYGFRHLPPGRRFRQALGVGSAYGVEFEPIVDRLDAVTILEPSDQMVSASIGGKLRPSYVKPAVTGMMPFRDATFDLAVCLGTLHHIPNVSTVLAEMGRVIEPGGYALIREPIVSMGDWRSQRKPGVTKRERGIPLALFREMVTAAGFTIEGARVCVFPAMSRLGRAMGCAQYDSAFLTAVDHAASVVTKPLYRYHAASTWQKVRPTSLFIVARR